MFDAVQDKPVLPAEYDVAVFAHKLHYQPFFTQIPHLIQVFDLKFNDPLQSRLGDFQDPSGSDMLSQKHAEVGGSQGAWLVFLCKIDQGKARAC